MLPGLHLHAIAWCAAALLWSVGAHRALARCGAGSAPVSFPRRASLCLATAATVAIGARLHFLLDRFDPGLAGGSVRADTISRAIAAVVGVGGDPGPPTPGLRIGGGLAAAVLLLVSVGPCWLG
ncbi:MAG: hypothetical protein ACKOCT_08385, partial [Alphaproteobacteria bacterium]